MIAHADPAAPFRAPIQPGLSKDQLKDLLGSRFGLALDPRDRWDQTFLVPRDRLHEVARFLRDDPSLLLSQLLDIAGIDYLSYPNHRGTRYAAVYLFKSIAFRHRVKLKVEVDEEDAAIPSLHDLFKLADWLERETWDQYGIDFTGHPNLKRLLNHHEFVGHPLRKDYPCQKRQKLSLNDPLMDQLEVRLKAKGYEILDLGETQQGLRLTDAPAKRDGVK